MTIKKKYKGVVEFLRAVYYNKAQRNKLYIQYWL